MIIKIKRIVFLLWLLFLPVQASFSQHSSRNNYAGAWETPESWSPAWDLPLTSISGVDITINGYITVNGSLSFKGTANTLIINDTLVIKGDLLLDNNNDIIVNDSGILIVMGNFTINNQTNVIANGYLVVGGNLTKNSTLGLFTSNDNPVKVFIGGIISPAGLTNDYPDYPALNCTAPITNSYPNSTCSYGNKTDIESDSINSFFQNTCSISNVNTNSSVCATGTINLTSSHGTSYIWSGPNGFTSNLQNPIISSAVPAMTGAYTITVIAAPGCIDTDTVNIIVNVLPVTPTVTASGPLIFCAGDSVILTSSEGITYMWSTGATSASLKVIQKGSYTVKVTDTAGGCQSEASVATDVKVNALPVTPTITTSGPTTICAGGSVTLISSGGKSYLWSTGATTANIKVTTTGSYTVQVTNVSGCQSPVSVATIVTVNDLPVTPTITSDGPTTFCAGGNVTLISSDGTSYLWSNAATTQNINVSASGIYNVRVMDANGCQSAVSADTVVKINALPVVNAGTNATIPNGTNTTIDATVAGIGPFTYSWEPSGNLVNAFIEDPKTVILATTTVFTLIATSATTSCSNTDEVIITISGGPLSSTPSATPGTVCAGAEVQLYALAGGGSGSYTYTWTSAPGGFTSTIAEPIVNPTVNTTYNVAVFDGFTTVNSQVTVKVNPLPATPNITTDGTTTFCAGGSVILTSGAGTSYLWSNDASAQNINVTSTGSYTVQVTNASGCQSAASVATIVTLNDLPVTPTITADGPTAFCDGGSVTLTSGTETSYLWSNDATTSNVKVTAGGSYSVQVTNESGCQSAPSVATIITVNALPATPTITTVGPIAFCAGSSITLTSSEETSYLWSNAETTQNIDVTTAGSYTIQVSDANGCLSAVSVAGIVTVNALPATPNITTDGPTTFCDGGGVTLTSSAEKTYLWSNAATSPDIYVTTTGSYTLQVTDENGCQSSVSAATVVTVNALPATPTITAGGPTTFCTGGIVTLTSSAGTNYLWSNAETTPGINVTTEGSFTVLLISASGCQSSASAATVVTVNENPVASAGQDQVLKFVFETVLNAELSSSETGEWSLISGSGKISDNHSPTTGVSDLSTGENIFLWNVHNGNCQASAEVKITVFDLFIPSVITPGSDGKNDFFKISEHSGQVEVIIFNRWGNEEYTNSNYLNDWDGRNNKGLELPNETYFYILKFENGKIKKGSVLIKR